MSSYNDILVNFNSLEISSKNVKPILKWVGGKTQIIDKIIKEFPKEINNYHEIFLGGGSVLLALLLKVKNNHIKLNGSVYAYDINETLIYVYKNIQKNHKELFNNLQIIKQEFIKCQDNSDNNLNRKAKTLEEAKLCKENYYYWIRNKYNLLEDKKSIFASCLFIFLNKTCFRGLYKEGKNGFNVPYGNYKNPEIINEKHLELVSNLIKDVKFVCRDFTLSMDCKNFNEEDFIYLDPPYVPINSTSFIGYTRYNFDNLIFFELIHKLTNKNIRITMSNSNSDLVKDNFKNYDSILIECKRAINCKNPNSKVKELIIKNY